MPEPRPSFKRLYMALAFGMAKRSTCRRLSVGTLIVSEDYRQVFAVGYNGTATGLEHNCTGSEGACGCLHSEENAIINCRAAREVPKLVFVTHLPCPMCAKRLINLGGVTTVYYTKPYRDTMAKHLLKLAQIRVFQITPCRIEVP